jgi:hypothetical protein
VKVKISDKIFKRLDKLREIKRQVIDDAIYPASVGALWEMQHIIDTDENAGAYGVTASYDKYEWSPAEGRNSTSKNMRNKLTIHERDNGVFLGWENPPDYVEGQDIGWGDYGDARQPKGAIFKNVRGADFTSQGYEVANKILDDMIPFVVKENK